MLTLHDLRYSVAEHHYRFELTLAVGETLAILGRSGSGKSTLLSLVAGFIQPDSGDIRWQNRSILALRPAERPVTSLFQQHNLFPHLTVSQNVGLGLDPGLKLDRAGWQSVDVVLTQVGLAHSGERFPDSLSGGEQQRVALARCLLRRHPVLLLDEPYSALDESTREEMLNLTRDVLNEHDLSALLVTHLPADADALSARVLYLFDGELHNTPAAER